ncbi:hypothetical protein DFJ73DRAFT_452322 [Zopfochytrium polystomum]|nr:hypothetical protein DFJ73DRAFT_452322 [Zopfochytrium polystomum]
MRNKLSEVGLLPLIVSAITTLAFDGLERAVEKHFGGVYDTITRPLTSLDRSRLEYHVYRTFCTLRTHELFDVIAAFPASQPALLDLKLCIQETDQESMVRDTVLKTFSIRLLHPGVNTSDIVNFYVQSMKTRKDSMRCVIELMTDYSKDVSNVIVDVGNGTTVEGSRRKKRVLSSSMKSDIFSLLLKIFESSDSFMKEFQILLGNRLLKRDLESVDAETVHLTMLKKYFPESKLQHCEVMIMDIRDSLALNVTTYLPDRVIPASAKVVSKLYWPELCTETILIRGQLRGQLDQLQEKFSLLKPSRSLLWLSQYGVVDLHLEFEDREVEISATIAQAALLDQFSTRSHWTLQELSEAVKASPSFLEKNLIFWINNQILQNIGGTYSVIESLSEKIGHDGCSVENKEEDTGKLVQDMKAHMPFLTGILTNFRAVPLDRIQKMLAQFSPGYNRTPDELHRFLDALVSDGTLDFIPPNYLLPRKT